MIYHWLKPALSLRHQAVPVRILLRWYLDMLCKRLRKHKLRLRRLQVRPFSNMFYLSLLFNRSKIVFKVLSITEDGFAPRGYAVDLTQLCSAVSGKKEVAPEA